MNVSVQGNRLAITFPFDLRLIEIVRTIPDRAWNLPSHKGIWSVPATAFHCEAVIKTLKPAGFNIHPDVVKCADVKAERPASLRKQLPKNLYPYQKEAVEFTHAARGRAIIGDAPGVGKTAPALVWTYMFGGKKALIVAPANVTYKWAEKEVPMWAAGKTVQVVEGGKKAIDPDIDIVIMSYRTMVMRFEELNRMPFDTMIFDEAHYLKSNKSQQNRIARKLVKGVPYLLFLTGTAFKNKRYEMFQLLHMIDPIAWPNAADFGVRYCGGVLDHGQWITPPNYETNTEELQLRLRSVMIRRTKKQVIKDLPDLTRTYLPIHLSNEKDYATTLRAAKEQARAEGYKPGSALVLLNKLRQVVGRGKTSAALEIAEDLLDAGEQVVMFAHHKEVIKTLVDGLMKMGINAYLIGVIDGSTPSQERQLLSMSFQAGHKRVMVISSAGKEGIDLFASSHLIMVERLWTGADEEQIEARVHRNGQKNAVTAYYPIAKGTVDERLDQIVRGKNTEFANLNETDVIRVLFMELLK